MTSPTRSRGRANAAKIETHRLYLRPCKRDDLTALHKLWTDPHVRKYLWDDVSIPKRTAEKVIQSSISDFRLYGFGQWAVFLRNEENLIGFCGLRHIENTTDVEILYALDPGFWKQGYATEAATAVLRYAFSQCDFQQIFGRTDFPNAASLKVLERLGMMFSVRERVNNLDTLKYSITKQEFDKLHAEYKMDS